MQPASGAGRARVVVVLVLLALLALVGMALVAAGARLGSGEGDADVADALHEVAPVPEDAADLVTWGPDAWRRERHLDPVTRVQVASAYLRAWAAISRWQSVGDRAAVDDTFTGQAEDAVAGLDPDPSLLTVDLRHRLTLTFFALDGATIAFRDTGALVVRGTGVGTAADSYVLTRETLDVVMELEDGYWRVAQLRRQDAELRATLAGGAGDAPVALSGADTVAATPVAQTLPARSLRATTYRVGDWSRPGVVARAAATDLARVRALGLDAVTVPLPVDVFDGRETDPDAEASLRRLLEVAEEQRVGVVLVCLDGAADLGPGAWGSLRVEVRRLAGLVGDAPALRLWELADAPSARGGTSPAQRALLALLLREAVRERDADTPVTLGWDDPADAADPGVAGLLDLVTLYAGPPRDADPTAALAALPDVVTAARVHGREVRIAAPRLGATGGLGLHPRTEAAQAWDVARVVRATDGFTVGALYDAGAREGLLAPDGTVRPAGEQVRDPVAGAPGWRDVLGSVPVRLAVLLLVVLALRAGWRRVRGPLRASWQERLRRFRDGAPDDEDAVGPTS